MLNIDRLGEDSPYIVYDGYSRKTLNILSKCMGELSSSGIPLNKRLCYLKLVDCKYHLFYSIKDLGYLSNKLDRTDLSFKKFLNSLKSDIGEFYCVVFPTSLNYFPFKDTLVVFKSEKSFSKFEKDILSQVKIVAYDSNNIGLALSNFTFNLVGSSEDRENKVRNLLLNSKGKASVMANRLNISGFGYVGWKVTSDSITSQKIMNEDSLGNIRYIELIL